MEQTSKAHTDVKRQAEGMIYYINDSKSAGGPSIVGFGQDLLCPI